MSNWIDLSRTMRNDMIHWPGQPPFLWERVAELTEPGTCNVSRITTTVHIGTHIDAPLHFIPDGIDIAEVPLAKLCGPGVVVHIPDERNITADDLASAGIERGDRVLLRTANEKLWDKSEFDEDFFDMTGEAAQWLVDHDVPMVGIDYLAVDGYHNPGKAAHLALLGNEVIIIECLDLSKAKPGRYEVVALPLKIAGADGSPARVIIRPL